MILPLLILLVFQVVSASYVAIRRLDDQLGNCFFTTSDEEMNQLINNVSSGYKYTSTIGYLDTIYNNVSNLELLHYQINISLPLWSYSFVSPGINSTGVTGEGFMGYCSATPYPGSVALFMHIDNITGYQVLFTGCSDSIYNYHTCYVYGNDSITTQTCATTAAYITSTSTNSTTITTPKPTTTTAAVGQNVSTTPDMSGARVPFQSVKDPLGNNINLVSTDSELVQNIAGFTLVYWFGYLGTVPNQVATIPLYRVLYPQPFLYGYVNGDTKDSLEALNMATNDGFLGYCSERYYPELVPLYYYIDSVTLNYVMKTPFYDDYGIPPDLGMGLSPDAILCYIYKYDLQTTTTSTTTTTSATTTTTTCPVQPFSMFHN